MTYVLLVVLGLCAGGLAGAFGVGGGIIIVPALVALFGFSQKMATGTSLALMLPPIGIAAVVEYYRSKNINVLAAGLIIIGFVLGSYLSAKIAVMLPEVWLKRGFGVLLIVMGIKSLLTK
ncbi:MAG: sulfite exporter TauE/SafE family protein [Armatimonadota bacterium]